MTGRASSLFVVVAKRGLGFTKKKKKKCCGFHQEVPLAGAQRIGGLLHGS